MEQDKLGRFIKGTHWRKRKPFWDKNWLWNEYISKGRTASEIAGEFSVGDTAILFWIKKHAIPTRTISEVRKIKKWGLSGSKNGMFGRTGEQNPNWNGGHSPERQSQYARSAWKELAKSILKRDIYKCRRCSATHSSKNKLVVHHKRQWSKYPEHRFNPRNLITVCLYCHRKIHKEKLKGWLIP